MTFHAGQKVVCVNANPQVASVPWKIIGGMDGLTVGNIYTIRAVGSYGNIPVVWLEEIRRPGRGSIGKKYGEPGYHPCRFHPVVERKTSIEIFHQIRRDVENKVPAELVGEQA